MDGSEEGGRVINVPGLQRSKVKIRGVPRTGNGSNSRSMCSNVCEASVSCSLDTSTPQPICACTSHVSHQMRRPPSNTTHLIVHFCYVSVRGSEPLQDPMRRSSRRVPTNGVRINKTTRSYKRSLGCLDPAVPLLQGINIWTED